MIIFLLYLFGSAGTLAGLGWLVLGMTNVPRFPQAGGLDGILMVIAPVLLPGMGVLFSGLVLLALAAILQRLDRLAGSPVSIRKDWD